MSDFTLKKYVVLCNFLKNHGYTFLTVQQILEKSDPITSDKFVIIRHDVDRWIKNAKIMAETEANLGIQSTYYFRYPGTFHPNIIKFIFNLGHEVGYHYEVLSKNNGDETRAMEEFEDELSEFRSIVPVKTICMHGNPLSKYDNRSIWNNHRYQDYGIIGEAYLSLQHSNYFTDTGRTWAGNRAIYDKMNEKNHSPDVASTDALISWISESSPENLYLTVHPERWAPNPWRFLISWIMDLLVNLGKSGLHHFTHHLREKTK